MYGIIYRIVNRINGKLYVGQTVQSLKARWKEHRNDVKRYDYPIYRAIRKYGIENFYPEQLDTANDQEELDLKEIYYSEYYNTMKPNGYNLKIGNGQGYLSEETKRKMSEAKTGEKHWKFEKIITEQERQRLISIRPKFWSEEAKERASILAQGEKNRFFGKHHKKEVLDKLSTPILCVETGIVYSSIAEACRVLMLHDSNVQNVISGKRKHTGGFTFKSLRENISNKGIVKKIECVETGIIYESISALARNLGIHRNRLTRNIKKGMVYRNRTYKFL